MAEDRKDNDIFDQDDLDELPDVVLGEKTRAMRAVRENGKPVEDNSSDDTLKRPIFSDESSESQEETASVPAVDQSEGKADQENTSEEPSQTDRNRIDLQFLEKQNEVSSSDAKNAASDTAELNHLSSEKTVQNTNVTSTDTSEKQSVDDTDQNEKSQDNNTVSHVQKPFFNENEDDDEIPTSVIDDDPGIRNDLDNALNPKKSRHDETDPLPPVQDELSRVYSNSDETAVKGKHAAHQSVSDDVPSEDQQETSGTAETVSAEKTTEDTDQTDQVSKKKKQSGHKKKRKGPLLQRIVTVIIIILLILLAIGIYEIYDSLQPVTSQSAPVSFQVNQGETIRDVSDSLAKEGIIKDARTGYYYARLNHLTDVKRGVFQLDKSWSLKQMYTYLNDDLAADQNAVIVTLTEGDWAKDMADKIAASTNVKADDLMALWNNDDYIRTQLMPDYPFLTDDIFNENIKCDLEGYLAPDTYTFNQDTTAEEVTKKILDQSKLIYQKHADQINSSGYSIHQIYTLASIVQGESSREDQMKKIAGVFYNRLKQNMPLQSSVTTCYIIDFDKGKTAWQECEASYNTEKQDPYNTYLNQGLPPGPVQNPGEAAINAVLNPESNDYLFFMADVCGNTGIHYARTEAEHEANVAKYNTCN